MYIWWVFVYFCSPSSSASTKIHPAGQRPHLTVKPPITGSSSSACLTVPFIPMVLWSSLFRVCLSNIPSCNLFCPMHKPRNPSSQSSVAENRTDIVLSPFPLNFKTVGHYSVSSFRPFTTFNLSKSKIMNVDVPLHFRSMLLFQHEFTIYTIFHFSTPPHLS